MLFWTVQPAKKLEDSLFNPSEQLVHCRRKIFQHSDVSCVCENQPNMWNSDSDCRSEPLNPSYYAIPVLEDQDRTAEEFVKYPEISVSSSLENSGSSVDVKNQFKSCSMAINAESEINPKDPDPPATEKRRRKGRGCKRTENKIKRMKGESYLGFGEIVDESGSVVQRVQNVVRPARKIGHRCTNHTDSKSCLKCGDLDSDERQRIFENFWTHMNWKERKDFVSGLVRSASVKRRRGISGTGAKRSCNHEYFLPRSTGGNVRVCKVMFADTLGISEFTVLQWVTSKTSPSAPASSKRRNDTVRPKVYEFIQEFLDQLPKLPSHYSRSDTSEFFLEPAITSHAQLFSIYVDFCRSNNQSPVSITTFMKVFHQRDYSLFQSKEDTCEICESYKNGQTDETIWKAHDAKKDRARLEKNMDKSLAMQGKCHVLSVDLSFKQTPICQANSLYFKSKLYVFNYTVCDAALGAATCYWWNESQGGVEESVFATILVDYIERKYSDDLPIIVYSDGCAYQNRNSTISNALLNLSLKKGKVIVQKFLEKGHTQTECDSIHSTIEKRMKSVDIRLPSDYLSITKSVRKKPSPIETVDLSYEFFRDYTGSEVVRVKSIRPGVKKTDPQVKDICGLQYSPDGSVNYKILFDDDWQVLPAKPFRLQVANSIRQLFDSPRRISEEKWKDLQELKSVIPTDCHSFYDTLKH